MKFNRLMIVVWIAAIGLLAKPALTEEFNLFARSNLVAWCIVPFDSKHRSPADRAAMVKNLGFTKVAYDWRGEHVASFEQEILEYQKNGLDYFAFWTTHDKALELFDKYKIHPQLWVMVPTPKGELPDDQKYAKAAEMLLPTVGRAAKLGCQVGLYNHGGWGGEPETMVAVAKLLKEKHHASNVGIVYNLHHSHEAIDRFPQALAAMKPYLLCFNLSGITKNGPKIIPIGAGELDLQLLKTLRKSGYRGPIGILGHTNDDVEERLKDNLDGLDWLVPQLDGKPAGPKPAWRTYHPGVPASGPVSRGPSSTATGQPSLSPAFGRALSGGMLLDAKPEFAQRPVTLECRAKLNSKSAFNIIVASDPKSSKDHWELYSYARTGFLSLYQPGRGGEFRSEVDICDGQWHFLAAVIEPTRVRLYVDGKQVLDRQAAVRADEPHPAALAFGRLVEGNLGCDGLLDDVRLTRGIRDIGAVPANPTTADDRTIGLWNFDDLPSGAAGPRSSINYWAAEDAAARARLPIYQTIPAAKPDELTPTNGWPAQSDYANWYRSHGNDASTRYSPLDQINVKNVSQLQRAWTYHSKDGPSNIQCNPIIVDGVMYAPTSGNHVVAINAETGAEIWRFTPVGRPAHRGLTYHKGDDGVPRLIFAAGSNLWTLDPKTGAPVAAFGKGGKIDITDCVAAPGVFKNVLVYAGWNRDVFGVDLTTGKPLWRFNTIPEPGEENHDTWDRTQIGANCWGGMAIDSSRGIAYVCLGSPKPNFVGVGHRGDNLYGNCLLAIDMMTGKRVWHFQEIRHDIWDLDTPATPTLVTITHEEKRVDAVAAVTKIGNTLLVDRVTGKPLFPFRLRRAPVSTLLGEQTGAYQPDVELPEPFSRQEFKKEDITELSPQAHDFVVNKLEQTQATWGWFRPFDEGKPLAMYGIHGGAEWTGASFDPVTGLLYINSNQLAWLPAVARSERPLIDETKLPPTPGRAVYVINCMPCHGPNREGLAVAPSLLGVRQRLSEQDIQTLWKTGRGTMPVYAGSDADKKILIDYLFDRDRPNVPLVTRPERPSYRDAGYPKLLDNDGYPGTKPPWGELVALNLTSGTITWRVPLGEFDELTKKGIPKTGTENFGGPMVTAGGLVFCGGTRDRKFRAFDKTSGAEVWSAQLDHGGFAPPATYSVNGRQYVVISDTGGGKLAVPPAAGLAPATGDAYVAFRLP